MTNITRRSFIIASSLVGSIAVAGCTDTVDDNGTQSFDIETVVDGLEHPWSVEPTGRRQCLVTERTGRLTLVDLDEGSFEVIDGVPKVHVAGQGGLLDVTVHPAYPDEPWVYLTFSDTNVAGESATHLARGQLEIDTAQLTDVEIIHIAEPFVDSNNHYGSRIVFGDGEKLYMTSGDRQFKNFGPDHVSQDLSNDLGATLRLEPDGSIPADNPFNGEQNASKAIYSYGHRNAQGMAVHPTTGELWQSEHGEHDGDELNIITRGGNHGWPIAHYGCQYGSTDPIGDLPHERDDVIEPVYHWECTSGGFPPAGMTFYDGDAFSRWQGDLFVGNLAGRYLGHFTVDQQSVEEVDPLLEDQGWRVRDVSVEPSQGHLLVAIDASSAPLVELVPR